MSVGRWQLRAVLGLGLLAQGGPGRAAGAPVDPVDPAQRVGQAREALGQHRPEAVEGLLGGSAGVFGPLEPYRWALLAQAAQALKQPHVAVEDWGRAAAQAPVEATGLRWKLALAQALLADNQPCEAVKALDAAAFPDADPLPLKARAQAVKACGKADAAEVEKRLWLQFPEDEGDPARELQFGAAATLADRQTRATKLYGRAEPGKAAVEAEKALALKPGAKKAQLLLLLGKAESDTGRKKASLGHFAQVAALAPKSDAAGEALTLLARAAWRRAKYDEASAYFARLATRKDRFGDEAAFLDAFMAMDSGALLEGADRFERFLKDRPHSRKSDEAAWFAAYATFRAGKRDLAREKFGRLAADYPDSSLAPAGLYWAARTSKPRDAEALYRQTIRAAPLSYYAAMSRPRLAELKAAPEPDVAPAEPLALPASDPDVSWTRIRALGQAGLLTERSEALEAALEAARGFEAKRQLAALCGAVGDWGRAYNLANRNQIQLATLSPARASALLYPLAYATEVRAAADAMGIDPAFIWAIMRRESAFDPTVTSPAHALGLMQMLVPTAGRIASLLGQAQRPAREQLYDPSVELPYAAWYLAELWGRFGHVGLAAAGYNAGPRAVASWVRDRGDLPFDEFVEAIPYRETRLYVKNVLADYLAYRALYPTQAPLGPLPDRLDRPRPGVGF